MLVFEVDLFLNQPTNQPTKQKTTTYEYYTHNDNEDDEARRLPHSPIVILPLFLPQDRMSYGNQLCFKLICFLFLFVFRCMTIR